MTREDKLLIIGTGNVAYNLANAFKKQGIDDIDILGKTANKAKAMASVFGLHALKSREEISDKTNLTFICVTDDKVSEVIKDFPLKQLTLVHTAGAVDMSVFTEKGIENYGVFYPLQSLSKNNLSEFQEVPICVEANNKWVLAQLNEAASAITKKVVEINSEQRAILHLAAVFANNFSNHLYALSEKLLNEKKLSYDLLKPLISQTAANACIHSPAAIQTGPAKRGDELTMKRHLDLLNDDKLETLYQLLSESIKELTSKRNDD